MKKRYALLLSLFLLITPPKMAYAETVLSIEGNGDSSNNTVNAAVENTTTVTQSNNADVSNQVDANADTGNNTAVTNGGDANISTGNIDTSTNIQNQNINSNFVDGSSCGGCNCGGSCLDGEAIISGNGADSNSTININNGTNSTLTQFNNANITNNVTVHANTGGNTANNNSGDVRIETGNIKDRITINNKNINQSNGFLGGGEGSSGFLYKIFGNGEGSVNNIYAACFSNLNYSSVNYANIVNNVVSDPNTGNNTANGNNGSVLISTGNIDSVININNKDINGSDFTCSSCKKPVNPPPPPVNPPPVVNPPQPPVAGVGPGSSSNPPGSNNGDNIAAVLGAMLPATGGYWLFLLTLGLLIAFFYGLYLRLHSGNSSGVNA